jgi:hypothetical protein
MQKHKKSALMLPVFRCFHNRAARRTDRQICIHIAEYDGASGIRLTASPKTAILQS